MKGERKMTIVLLFVFVIAIVLTSVKRVKVSDYELRAEEEADWRY